MTLVIIGIVAAMTVPTLTQHSRKQEYLTGLKKFYSTFQNGLRAYMAKQSCATVSCTGMFSGEGGITNEIVRNNLTEGMKNSFHVIKSCYSDEDSTCRADGYKILAGTSTTSNANKYIGFTLADGMKIFMYQAGSCANNLSNPNKLSPYCAFVFVDVNGDKGPKQQGRDLFSFVLSDDGFLYPVGGADYGAAVGNPSAYWKTSGNCGNAEGTIPAGTLGSSCSGRIIEESWQMNY